MSTEQLAPFDNAIRALEEQHFHDDVSYEDYIFQKIILSSQRMDATPNARSRNMWTTLEEVLNSPQWNRARVLGFESHNSTPVNLLKGQPRINSYITALQQSAGIEPIDNRFYLRMVTGNERNDELRMQIENLLKLFEQAGIDDSKLQEKSLISSIILQGVAFSFIGQTVSPLSKGVPSVVEEGNEEHFWTAKLLGTTDRKNNLPYSLGFSLKMEKIAQQKAADIM